MDKRLFVTESMEPNEKLYKYYSNIDNAAIAIKKGVIHLDNPKEYNDPFEAVVSDKINLKYKVSCFGEIWNSILMWSYYANCHKGICIEFNINKLRERGEWIYDCLKAVHYSEIRPNINDVQSEYKSRCFLTKSKVWEHEHEWRLISKTTEEWCEFDCVSAIYFGIRTNLSQENVKRIIKFADKSNIPIYQCEMDSQAALIRWCNQRRCYSVMFENMMKNLNGNFQSRERLQVQNHLEIK